MKPFTFRVGHLEYLPEYCIGDIITAGNKIGRMGTTGQSEFNHVHMDVVEGFVDHIIRLSEIGYEDDTEFTPNIKQLQYFLDDAFFGGEPLVVTTPYYELAYKIKRGKDHPAYDIVPKDRHETTDHFDMFWNRTKEGTVLKIGYDEHGYGFYILIGFEA